MRMWKLHLQRKSWHACWCFSSSAQLWESGSWKRTEMMLLNQRKLDWSSGNDNPINLFFTIKELRDGICSGANATPGRDVISFELYKHLDDIFLNEALFNAEWAEGCLPMEWKHNSSCLEKGQINIWSQLIPLTLTSVLCKIMEWVITNRLVYF